MKVFLFLDFDGTLAPIADTPRQAVLPPVTKRLLGRLSRRSLFKVAVISGRTLGDLRRRIALPGVIYAGNHGLEMAGPKLSSAVTVGKDTTRLLGTIYARLKDVFSGIPGVLIENKGITVGFHYRLVAGKARSEAKQKFYAVMRPYLKKRLLTVQPGKMVLEVKPPVEWDKGKAVEYILDRYPGERLLPVFIGDDATDEAAFKALRGKGITVHVGKRCRTAARFRLKDTEAVQALLKELDRMQVE